MKSMVFLLVGIILFGMFSCAAVPTGPLTPGELRLLSIDLPGGEKVKVKSPYEVTIYFEADGEPEIESACFSWSGDRPNCFKVLNVNWRPPKTIKVKLRTSNPGEYILEGYVIYIRDGKRLKTNVVSSRIFIIKEGKSW